MDTACVSCGTALPCIMRAPATSYPLPSTSGSLVLAAMAIALCTQHTYTRGHQDKVHTQPTQCAYHTRAASRPSPPQVGEGMGKGQC